MSPAPSEAGFWLPEPRPGLDTDHENCCHCGCSQRLGTEWHHSPRGLTLWTIVISRLWRLQKIAHLWNTTVQLNKLKFWFVQISIWTRTLICKSDLRGWHDGMADDILLMIKPHNRDYDSSIKRIRQKYIVLGKIYQEFFFVNLSGLTRPHRHILSIFRPCIQASSWYYHCPHVRSCHRRSRLPNRFLQINLGRQSD